MNDSLLFTCAFHRLQKSNPLPKEESQTSNGSSISKKQSSFQERLRAERESFKAVFDRRKRIGGLDIEDD